VLNVFRMLGMITGDRVRVSGGTGYDAMDIVETSVRAEPDIDAFAAISDSAATVLVWNYHDDDVAAPPAAIRLRVSGLPAARVLLTHYRVDETHGNSYAVWKSMGSPQEPTAEEYEQLEDASALALLGPPEWIDSADGTAVIGMALPRQGVSLLRFTWERGDQEGE
jgi:xylan 1,4-beta-xylosidase